MSKVQVSDEDFVKSYVASVSYEGLAATTGLKETSVQARASKLRKAGVNLVPYERKKKEVDVEGLNSLLT
jgi:hypothetical protein